jgi:hypothetical protein
VKILKRTLFIIGILFTLLITALAVVSYFVLTPERITPIVLKIANEQLNAEVNFEELDVSLISTFPNMGIKLKNGSIVAKNDTLLSFVSCRISFRPLIYIREKRISINSIEIDRPRIFAHIDSDGQNNWAIFPSDTTVASDTTRQLLPDFGIRKFQLFDAQIIYSDNQAQQLLSIGGLQLTLSARQKNDTVRLRLEMDVEQLNFQNKGKQMLPEIPVKLSAQLRQSGRNLQIRKADFSIATLNFNLVGQLQWNDTTSAVNINTDFSLKTPAIADVLTKVSTLVPTAALLKTSGSVAIKGTVNGTLSDKSFPIIDAEIKIAEGKVRSALNPNKLGIELLEIDGTTHIDINRKTPSTLQLKRFIFHGPSTKLDVSGKISHLFTDPQISALVDADIDFTGLAKELIFIDSTTMKGHIRSNLSGEFALSHLLNRDIGKLKIQGEINVDSLLFDYPQQQLYISAPFVQGVFGTNSSDSIRGQLRESLLCGRLNANNFELKWEDIQSNIRSLSAVFSTSAPADSMSIAPVFANLRLNALNFIIPSDSLRLRAALASGIVRISPQPGNPAKPLFNVRLSLDTLRMRMPEAFVMMNQGKLSAQIKERITRRPATSSARTSSRRDSVNMARTNTNDDILDMRLESEEVRDILQKWDVNANLECKRVRVRTPFFPLRTSISEGTLAFDNDTLRLRDLAMQAGKSAMQLNGSVAGIRQALLRNGRISADLHLSADTLDVNEITLALVAASKYTELKTSEKQQLTQSLEKSDVVLDEEAAMGVFIIPRNINLKIRTAIKHAIYSRMTIDNLNSDIYVRNHTLEMPDMKLQSNLGDIQLSLVYQAINTKGAYIGLDMDLQQIQVKQLIESFPALDSLTPMLRSFEGVVNCNMTAVTNLDSLMNVEFPTAIASCHLKGKDLVLMDSETFAEIAKTLWFKNKQRNLIDSLSVEIIMEDNCLLVFPFLLSLDRYQVAVGGTQRLDLSFDYHISILKSPIPFRFGLNVRGTPDKYKIRIATAKYSNLFKPAKTTSLADAKLNVRQEFQNKLRSDIQTIVALASTSQATVRLSRQQQRGILNNADIQRLLVTEESEIISESTEGMVDETEEIEEVTSDE